MKPFDYIPQDIACIADYRRYAEQILTPSAWHYIDGASADEITKQENENAFANIKLKQRVLSGVREVNSQVQLFGQDHSCPILLAPVAYQKLAHPSGEVGAMQAAAAQNTGYVLSTLASSALEEVIGYQEQNHAWFQLYVQPSWSENVELVQRAERAGYSALVITVDAPVNGLRNREHRAGFSLPCGINAVNICGNTQVSCLNDCLAVAPTWQTIAKIKAATTLPVILKGISCVDDALLAKEYGIEGIVVSNHGGRVLDGVVASISVLPAIREAVGEQMTILLDSGVRRGSDIVKALVLGADAILLGRPLMYALATAGPLGVAHMLRVLKDEFEMTMALCGCSQVADLSVDILADN